LEQSKGYRSVPVRLKNIGTPIIPTTMTALAPSL
jgi:hypothetical protein